MGLVFRESPNLGNEPKLTLLPVRKRLKSPSNFFQNWRAGRRGTARRSRAGSSLRFDPPSRSLPFLCFPCKARRGSLLCGSERSLPSACWTLRGRHPRSCLPARSILHYISPSDDEGPHAPRGFGWAEHEQTALRLPAAF